MSARYVSRAPGNVRVYIFLPEKRSISSLDQLEQDSTIVTEFTENRESFNSTAISHLRLVITLWLYVNLRIKGVLERTTGVVALDDRSLRSLSLSPNHFLSEKKSGKTESRKGKKKITLLD